MENLGLLDHPHMVPKQKMEGKGKGQRTKKQDEDQTRPATHSPKLLRDIGHRGTMDTEGQRTLTYPTQSAT